MTAPRVFVVDDHAMVRAGVRAELGDDVAFVGEGADVPTAVEGIRATRPDVVLLDVHMPGGGGRAVLETLRTELPDVKWLALSVSDAAEDVIAVIRAGARGYVTKTISGSDLLDVHMPDGGGLEVLRQVAAEATATQFLALSVSDAAEDVIAVIRAGARGYVTKTISGTDLADAVRRVNEGDAVFSPRLAGFVLDAFAGGGVVGRGRGAAAADHDADLDQLTPREREVLQHIARGYMYKEIAQRLGISPKTVEAHVSAVLRKLQLSSRHELTRWAAERRLVD